MIFLCSTRLSEQIVRIVLYTRKKLFPTWCCSWIWI